MIRSIRRYLIINLKQRLQPIVYNQTTQGIHYPFSDNQNNFKKPSNEDDDENMSFSDLLKKSENDIEKQREMEEKRKEYQSKFLEFDPRKMAYQNLNAKEKTLDDDEIVRHKKETFTYTNQDNPFYNPDAAILQRQLSADEEILREWQYNFKMKHKRRPSLSDMEEDPHIKKILETRQKKKNEFKKVAFRFKADNYN